ncbi:MAG: Gfo/Idh/MocA family oxidoreductase [Bacteroidota bacterium]|nr:Gfo/Idh/MocA family oxidoreductase [Bacteroidota bacterium]
MSEIKNISRREFVSATTKTVAGAFLLNSVHNVIGISSSPKMKLAIVGTGHRAVGMWGKDVVTNYGESTEFVGLCDINPGRLEYAKKHIGINCPVFTDFETMVHKTKPDTVIVTTVDGNHHTFIAKALAMGCNVITEKPLTTDEVKLKQILDAEKKYNKQVIMAFNYRFTPYRAKIKELLMQERIGRLTSVDFNWYLDVYHGADYFRRWHRLREHSGSLLVHKSTHHFDLLNWWIDSDPEIVTAFGALEFYGKNNPFRFTHCRPCPHKDRCKFFFDLTKNKYLMDLYAANKKYDGYLRDGCVWKEDIDIYDKMAVQIKYANNVQVSYSLTSYSPYEGYRIAFNGTKGRIDAWIHQRQSWAMENFNEFQLTDNFGNREFIQMPRIEGGHNGGDILLLDRIFLYPTQPDELGQSAGLRDGAMSILTGVAARKSIDTGLPIKIADLSEFVPQKNRKG